MFGFLRISLARRAEAILSQKAARSAEDFYGLLSSGGSAETHELYEAVKFFASSLPERRNALKDGRFGDMLTQIDSRVPTLNSSYIGNFALRLSTIVLSSSKNATDAAANADKGRELLSRLANTMIQKGGQPREISQVAFAAAAIGLDNDALYEFAKHQMTLQIEAATPDSLNLSLQTAYKRNSRDKIYYALLCEKLCELTDRFTALDVMHTLRALAKTGLLKGFLLRRLSTLIMDNLDQFTVEQLAEASYRLSQLKFLTNNNFAKIFSAVNPKLDSLSDQLKLELLAAGCLCGSGNTGDITKLLSSLSLNGSWDISGIVDYIYACAYLKSYGPELQKALDELSQRNPVLTRKYALLLKESLDAFEVEAAPVQVKLGARWKDAISTFEKTENELTQTTPGFQEVKKILQGSSNNFAEGGQVGPFSVPFLDAERKMCILIEFASNMSPLIIKKRCLEALEHRVGVVKYWEWRRLKTESSQADYMAKILQHLAK